MELVIKQRDVRGSNSLLIAECLQDAFTCAAHRFDQGSGKLIKLLDGQIDKNTTFPVPNHGTLLFDGSNFGLLHLNAHSYEAFLNLPLELLTGLPHHAYTPR